MKRKTIVYQITSAAIVAIASTIVWAVVLSYGSRLANDLFGHAGRQSEESLVVTVEGTPLIVTVFDDNWTHPAFRKLDGTAVELEDQDWLYSGSLPDEAKGPGLLEYPVTWRVRLANTSDLGNPAVYWHFVRDRQLKGHAYFVGYDSVSKRITGFISREGFRAALPPVEEWFDVGPGLFGGGLPIYASPIGMDAATSHNYWQSTSAGKSTDPQWVGFLIDGDQLLRIDLRRRTVAVVGETPGASALEIGEETIGPPTTGSAPNEVSPESAGGPDEGSEDEYRRKTIGRLLVRFPDRVVAWDLKNRVTQEFLLPASLHDVPIKVYLIGNGQLLIWLDDGHWGHGPRYRLLWVDRAGNELRQEVVKLVGRKPPSERQQARDDAWAAPLPVYWIYRMFARRPLELLQHREAPTYWAALAQTWRAGSPVVVVLVLLAAIATVLSWRSCQRFARPNPIWWNVFVMLFSIPGFLAYWVMHRETVLETCGECGRPTPRDRDCCADCGKPFADPGLLGTEIFA